MKTLIVLLTFLFNLNLFSQEFLPVFEENQTGATKPKLIGCYELNGVELDKCNSEWFKIILSHTIKYPKKAIKEVRTGIVYFSFLIDEQGYIAKVRILKSSGHEDIDKALIKGVQALNKNKYKIFPAKDKNGDNISVTYKSYVNFKLEY